MRPLREVGLRYTPLTKKALAIARRVKAADLLHNSDLSRLQAVSGHDRERAEKYRKALEILRGED